jgi:translocation and assembly module TamA
VDDFTKYPNSLRFFAGGDNSVRGYDWKELGPVDKGGEVIGGKQVLTFSVEYDHRVLEQWVAAGFVDAGNAFDDDLNKLYYGAGFGVRWLSPVGAVRLDLAWPFNKDDGDTELGDVHVHFGFEVNL